MKNALFNKPNMNNLKGKKGRKIFNQIRNMQPPSKEAQERLRLDADACVERILARRKNEELARK